MVDEQLTLVEIAYAKPEKQVILALHVREGTTLEQAITESGILRKFPEINLENTKVGIFGKVCKLNHVLLEGDRIEIYRPLITDPKEHRRQRAAKGKKIAVDSGD